MWIINLANTLLNILFCCCFFLVYFWIGEMSCRLPYFKLFITSHNTHKSLKIEETICIFHWRQISHLRCNLVRDRFPSSWFHYNKNFYCFRDGNYVIFTFMLSEYNMMIVHFILYITYFRKCELEQNEKYLIINDKWNVLYLSHMIYFKNIVILRYLL